MLYFYGWGCPIDRFRAVSLFSKAVSRGGESSREGNYYMGLAYYNGYGVDKDVAKAMSFFEKSAELKDSKAIKTLKLIKSGAAKSPLTEWDSDSKSP
jgi:TPR repeat protein